MIELMMCSPRASGVQGVLLRFVAHPVSAAFLGFLVMIPDGWVALPGALLAAAVAWWAWAAQVRAEAAGKALAGAAQIVIEWVSRRLAQHVEIRATFRSHFLFLQDQLVHHRLGAPHVCLAPRLTPTPILTRARG